VDIDKTATTGNKIQTINKINNMTSRELSYFGSIWAPPAWMTETNKTTGNPKLREET